MTQPDRAAIDAMTKALDSVFGRRTPRYVKGDQIDDIPLGRRRYADDIASLSRAGMTEDQINRLLQEFAQVDLISARMIMARDRYKQQKAAITNSSDVSAIRKEFLAKHTNSHPSKGTVGAVESLPNLVAKYGEQAVKDMGYFSRQKQMLKSSRVIKDALEQSYLGNVKYSSKQIGWGKYKQIGQQVGVVDSGVAHNLKFIEELNRIGKRFTDYRYDIRDIRERERGGSSWGNVGGMLSKMGSRSSHPYRGQATLTPLTLPSNPARATEAAAREFAKQLALKRSTLAGQQVSSSNYLGDLRKAVASQSRSVPRPVPQVPVVPQLSTPTRSRPTLRSRLGGWKDAAIVGGLGGLGFLGTYGIAKAGSMAVNAWAQGMGGMLGFRSGGNIPTLPNDPTIPWKGTYGYNFNKLSDRPYHPPGKHYAEVKDMLLWRSKKLFDMNVPSRDYLIDKFVGEQFDPSTFSFSGNTVAGSTLGLKMFGDRDGPSDDADLKPNKELRNELRSGVVDPRKVRPYDSFLRSSSKEILNNVKGATLFRSYPGINIDEDGFIAPDKSYQYMSMSPNTSFKFGPQTIRTTISDAFKDKIGFIGSHELEFITGRDMGWMVTGKNKNEDLYNAIPVTAGEYAFNKMFKNIPDRPSSPRRTIQSVRQLPKFSMKNASPLKIPSSIFPTFNRKGVSLSQDKLDYAQNKSWPEKEAMFERQFKDLPTLFDGFARGGITYKDYGFGGSDIFTKNIKNQMSKLGKYTGKGKDLSYGFLPDHLMPTPAGISRYTTNDPNISLSDKFLTGEFSKKYANDVLLHELHHAFVNRDTIKNPRIEQSLNTANKIGGFDDQFDYYKRRYGSDDPKDLQNRLFDEYIAMVGSNKSRNINRFSKNLMKMFWITKDQALEHIFNYKEITGLASSGLASLSNPIRVSDGELAISRGMVDKIGLDTLRKLNSGDMSAAFGKGFSKGGIFEYDGLGTGTSDSILEDADKGPRGRDASDIGFIIKRSSSDKLKGLLGGGFNKLGGIRGFAGGGSPSIDDIRGAFTNYQGSPYLGKKTMWSAADAALSNITEFTNIKDVIEAVLDSKEFNEMLGKGGKQGTKLYDNYKANAQNAVKSALNEIMGKFDSKDISDLQHSLSQQTYANQDDVELQTKINEQKRKYLIELTKGVNKKTKEQVEELKNAPTGLYRGDVRYSNYGIYGLNDLQNIGTHIPNRTELTSPPDFPLNKRSEPFSIVKWYRKEFSGILKDIGKEMFDPTETRNRIQSVIEMPIMGQTTSQQQQDFLDSNFKEYQNFGDNFIKSMQEILGPYVGNRRVADSISIKKETKDYLELLPKGVVDVADSSFKPKDIQTLDGQWVNAANDANATKKEIYSENLQRTSGIITINLEPDFENQLKKHNINISEVFNQAIQRSMPSEQASTGLTENVSDMFGKNDAERQVISDHLKDDNTVKTIKESTVNTGLFAENVKKVGMNSTGLYKLGDILRGLSWRFASLSMSAMGVYFSIQGLMMTFQQGLASITTPLADIEALFKTIGMSSAFGIEKGIFSAADAMEKLKVSQDDFIDGWKNLTNIQGTIQTLFASIGAKIFGGAEGSKFTDNILKGISDAFAELNDGGIADTVRELISSIVEALPAILPAIKGITAMLQFIADNPALVAMGAQLMVISLVLQPIMSGLAAIVTVGGGFATITNLILGTSKALWVTSAASQAAGASFAFATTRAASLVVGLVGITTAAAGLLVAYEAIAGIINLMSGEGGFKLPTITGFLLNSMSQGSYATGGEITGQRTAAIDDKTINAEEGEFVVRRDVAQKNKDKLKQFNATGVWPGDEKKALGGFVGPSAAGSPVEQTFQANEQIRQMGDLVGNTRSTQQLVNSASDSNAFRVNVLNWPDTWGDQNGDNRELPFDLGSIIPERLYGRLTPEVVAGRGQSPVTRNAQTEALQNLQEALTTSKRSSDNVNTQTNTNPVATSFLGYISQALNNLISAISKGLDALGKSIFNTITGLLITIDKGIQSVVSGLSNAFKGAIQVISTIPNVISEFVKGIGTALSTAVVNVKKAGVGNVVKDSVTATFSRGGAGNAAELYYQHGGQRNWGDTTDYGVKGSRTGRGFWDWFNTGGRTRMTPPGQIKGANDELVSPDGRAIMNAREMLVPDKADWLQPAASAITSGGDPYTTALGIQNMVVGNVVSNAIQGGLQRGALSGPAAIGKILGVEAGGQASFRAMAATGIGKGLGVAGSLLGESMQLSGTAPVVLGTGLLTSGDASDRYFRGELSADQLQSGQGKNEFAALIDSGAFSAAFGRGMKVWGDMSGKDDKQMISDMNNNGILNVGLSGLWNTLFGKENVDAFGSKLKGGNEGVSDLLRNGALGQVGVSGVPIVGDLNLGGSLADLNSGIYDLTAQLTNLDMGNIFGMGTAFVGMGATGVDLASNTANMVAQNPMSAAQLALTAGLPLAGPFVAAGLMPQTTDWMMKQGYGQQDTSLEGIKDIVSDPFTTQLPEVLTTANQPVVDGVNTVNKSITDGNAGLQTSLDIIAQNTANPTVVVQQATSQAQQALANGGTIGGKSTSAIDDKLIAGEEGEFVVKKSVASKYKDLLTTLNTTGKWPKGYSAGGLLGNLKTLFHPAIGSDNIYKSLQDTVFKELQSQYKEGMKVQYNFVKDAPKEFRNVINSAMKNMPREMKEALAASGKTLTFSHEPTIGGKLPKYASDTSAATGRVSYGKGADNIFVKHAGRTTAGQTRTAYHEMIHSAYNSAGKPAQDAFINSIESKGFSTGSKYWYRPTEIAARSSHSITPNSQFKDAFKASLNVAKNSIDESIKDFMSKSIKIKTPSLSSIEKPFVETFNKVGAGIDAAVKKGGEALTRKSSTINPASTLKVDMTKVYKEAYGLAIKDATKTSSTMFLPADFQGENRKLAQIYYQNNPSYYQEMWKNGKSGISTGSPIEQLITNWNADVGKFIYGDRDYLKSEREAYLSNQQNAFSGVDNDTIVGVYDFKAAIDAATKSINTSKWEWRGKVEEPKSGIDTSNWSWGYNNSEMARDPWYGNFISPFKSTQNMEEHSKGYGKITNEFDMSSGWWTPNSDPTKAYNDAQKALNDVYIGKYGDYITDPNGNKYGVGKDQDTNKYGATGTPEYIGGIAPLGSSLYGKNATDYVQSPVTSSNQQASSQQTLNNQPIIVQLTVSGEELATKRYIEVEVPNIVRQYAPQR